MHTDRIRSTLVDIFMMVIKETQNKHVRELWNDTLMQAAIDLINPSVIFRRVLLMDTFFPLFFLSFFTKFGSFISGSYEARVYVVAYVAVVPSVSIRFNFTARRQGG